MATKILIMGGTGYIGKFIVLASAKSEHPTFAMVRSLEPSSPKKAAIYQSFKDAGVTLIKVCRTSTLTSDRHADRYLLNESSVN